MLPNQKRKDRAVLPKPKLIVYIGKSPKICMNLTTTLNIAPNGPKSGKKGPNCGRNKTKDVALISRSSSLVSFLGFVNDPVYYIPVYYRLGTWLLAIA